MTKHYKSFIYLLTYLLTSAAQININDKLYVYMLGYYRYGRHVPYCRVSEDFQEVGKMGSALARRSRWVLYGRLLCNCITLIYMQLLWLQVAEVAAAQANSHWMTGMHWRSSAASSHAGTLTLISVQPEGRPVVKRSLSDASFVHAVHTTHSTQISWHNINL